MSAIRNDLGGSSKPLFLGHTWILRGTVVDGSDVAVNLTGCTFVWVLKTSAEAAVDLVRKTLVSGIVLGNQTTAPGTFTITINPTDTASVSHPSGGRLYHQADVTLGTDKDAVMFGNLVVQPVGIL